MVRRIKPRLRRPDRGFTLVEAVIVAVIVAILAAVGIPLYNGYLDRARQNAVETLANTTAAAANTYFRKKGDADLTLNKLNIFYDPAQHTIILDNANKTVTVNNITDPTITKTVPYSN